MLDNQALLEGLNSVTAIPVIPYKDGKIDFDGHAKNVRYLMEHNYLSDGRPRVVCIGGTSLLHHMTPDEQMQLAQVTGEAMGDEGIFISGIIPNPLAVAGDLIERQSKLKRAPDAYLLMPLSGIADPNGIYSTLHSFGDCYGTGCDARFIYYFRQPRDMDAVLRLLNESPHYVGVKVGTGLEHVRPLIDGVGDNAMVIWGIGDRSTEAAKLGAKGHTSGIAVAFARASDEINNAQRRGDLAESAAVEAKIEALEEIRFVNGREFNYSAVVEAMHLSGFDDIEGGEGGPFNPRVTPAVAEEVAKAIEGLQEYH